MHIEGLDNLSPVGSGGFSQVFRATETRYGRTVAAKVLNFVLDDPEDRGRFEQECRAMAQLSDHPNIVPLYSTTYTDDGYPVIVMEFFASGTLWARARRGASLAEILSVGVKISSALQTAHQRNVTHRDVKPQNVLISRYGEPGLTDFGISAFDRHHADHGKPRGITVAYAAPEALNGGVSPRTDVYSLAASLYTVLADQRPFDLAGRRQSAAELARRITTEDPPSLRDFGYSAAVDQAVRRIGMARSPAQRPATAAEFGDVLRTLESREGFEPTPWIEAHDLTLDTSSPTLLDQTESSAIIHLPTSTADEVALDDETSTPTRSRRLASVVAAVVVAVLLMGFVLLASRGGDDEIGDQPLPLPTVVDDFYVTPLPPSDVSLARIGDDIRLSWTNLNDDEVVFGIQAIRNGATVGDEFTTESTSIDFDPGDESCFTMRTIGTLRRGSTSLDIEPVCVSESTPVVASVVPASCTLPCTLALELPDAPDTGEVSIDFIEPLRPAGTNTLGGEPLPQQVASIQDGAASLDLTSITSAEPGDYQLRITSPEGERQWIATVSIEG